MCNLKAMNHDKSGPAGEEFQRPAQRGHYSVLQEDHIWPERQDTDQGPAE